jgi:hypothetical protein
MPGGDQHLDLPAALADRYVRRRPRRLAAARADQVRPVAVDGQEQVGRPGRVGAVRGLTRLLGAADRNRRRDQRRVLQRVESDPEGGRPPGRLDAQLYQVGGVVGVGRVTGVGVGAVRPRKGVEGRVLGARIVGVARDALRAVVVVQVVLVQELAAPVGARARDQDGGRVPDAAVLELRCLCRRAIEHGGARTRRGTTVERPLAREGRARVRQRRGADKQGGRP